MVETVASAGAAVVDSVVLGLERLGAWMSALAGDIAPYP